MVKDNEYTFTGFLVWIICALFFLYEFFLRTVIGTFQHSIMSDLHLTSVKYSLLSTTVFLMVYGLMQVPAGLIIDHFGLKKALILGAVVCAISSLGFSMVNGYWIAMLCRMLMGFGASFGFVALLTAVFDWLPNRRSAFFIGLSQFIGTMGPMLAAGPLEMLSQTAVVNWRIVFVAMGVFGAILSVLITLFVKNNQQQTGQYTILRRPEKSATSLKKLFTRSQAWYIAIFAACSYFAIEYLSENEGKAFIALKGHSIAFAAYMITLSWFGYAIGCPLLGYLSDLFSRRRTVMLYSALICLAAIVTIVFANSETSLIIAFFALGIGASGQSISYANVAEQFEKKYLAVGLSFNNAMLAVVGSINAPFIGWIIDTSRGKAGTSTSLHDYYLAFSVMIVMAVIAVISTALFIHETYCKSKADFTYLVRK